MMMIRLVPGLVYAGGWEIQEAVAVISAELRHEHDPAAHPDEPGEHPTNDAYDAQQGVAYGVDVADYLLKPVHRPILADVSRAAL